MSGYKNLQIVCEIKGVNYAIIQVVLELVGLIDSKNDLFRTYSLGMKQRLSIASALLNEPKVLILDEPTNGLDPEGIIQIRELIQQVAKSGTTILLASHMLDEVEKICSHVIVLKNGKSLYSGPVQEMSQGAAYFEILAADLVQLQNALKSLDFVQRFEVKSGLVQVFTKDGIDASVLNQSLAEQGVFLSHLNFKQENLESKFLHLVKQ